MISWNVPTYITLGSLTFPALQDGDFVELLLLYLGAFVLQLERLHIVTNVFFCPMPPHVLFVDFVVLPPGHGRSVTYVWGWDVHEAQLRCPDDVWVVIEEDVVPGGALNLKSTNLPRPWSPRESSPSRKIPTVQNSDIESCIQPIQSI